MHFSRVDIRGEAGGPIARLGLLGWTCIGSPDHNSTSAPRTHIARTLLSRDVRSMNECCDGLLSGSGKLRHMDPKETALGCAQKTNSSR